MKSSILISLVAFVSISIFAISCKKDGGDGNDIKEVTAKKIEGRWIIDSVVVVQRLNGNVRNTTHVGETDEYVEFGSDGKVHTFFVGNTNTSNYVVRDDKSITISGDSVYIIELTSNKFIYKSIADAGTLGSMEITYYLRK